MAQRVFIVTKELSFPNGTVVSLPLVVFSDKAVAEEAVREMQADIATAMAATLVSVSDSGIPQPMGRGQDVLRMVGLAALQFKLVTADVRESMLVAPAPSRLIVPS